MVNYRTIDGIRSRPPRYSLLSIIDVVNEEHRYTEGIEWLPDWNGDGHISAISATTGSLAAAAASIATIPSKLRSEPFTVWAGETASTLGAFERDYLGRVKRKLANTESYQAALEFWDGAIALAEAHERVPLTAITSDRLTAVGSPVAIGAAFAAIEAGLADELDGQVGMLHCTPQVLSLAYQNECVLNAGTAGQPLWKTPMGHTVVADAGYSGNGPGAGGENDADGTSQWIMGTDIVRGWLGKMSLNPSEIESVAAISRADNDVTIIARRPCILEWNLNVHVTAEVNIGTVDIGGAS